MTFKNYNLYSPYVLLFLKLPLKDTFLKFDYLFEYTLKSITLHSTIHGFNKLT